MDFLYQGERFPAPPTQFPSSSTYPVFEIREAFFRPGYFKFEETLRPGRMALTATLEAMEDAGLGQKFLGNARVGVCIGTNEAGTMGGSALKNRQRPESAPYILPSERFRYSNPTLCIARNLNAVGPFQTIVNACSAGSDAIGTAASWIRMGYCDVVIAGGVDALYPVSYNGFISLMNCDDSPCKPFDAERKGLNLGEGAAIMVLESRESYSQRDKKPRAFVHGYGSSGDAFHLTAPAPDGKGLRLAMEQAMTFSGIRAPDIAFINAHGTGTIENDRIEARLFHEKFPGTPFLSTKGYVGHALGASGALEAAFSVGCLEKGRIPKSAGFDTPDPDLPVSPVREVTKVEGAVAMSNTLAFGGNNAVLLLGKEGGR
jgi:3-oxoacyl-[acyl-carrier-protein] synthase-1/3-oxoacyl-[acyl-carrier-protein] synthase II